MFVYIILENISPPNPDDAIDETEEPNNDLNLDIPRTNNGCFFSTVCKRTGKQKGTSELFTQEHFPLSILPSLSHYLLIRLGLRIIDICIGMKNLWRIRRGRAELGCITA